jgi:hypothetical protein
MRMPAGLIDEMLTLRLLTPAQHREIRAWISDESHAGTHPEDRPIR